VEVQPLSPTHYGDISTAPPDAVNLHHNEGQLISLLVSYGIPGNTRMGRINE
jgi:hypothetical protein